MKTLGFAIIFILAGSVMASAQKKEMIMNESVIKWTGKKIGGSHSGEIQLKSAYLEFEADQIIGGKVLVDMNTISNTDLTNEGANQKLVGHLKSDDFFGVEKYPVSSFILTEASAFKNGKATIKGALTIKGITEEISADVVKKNGKYSTIIDVDRSKFNVRYGSKSFFNNLGDKAINDLFTLEIQLVL